MIYGFLVEEFEPENVTTDVEQIKEKEIILKGKKQKKTKWICIVNSLNWLKKLHDFEFLNFACTVVALL